MDQSHREILRRRLVGENSPSVLAELRFFIANHPWEVARLLSDARKLYPETKTGDNEEGDIEANHKAKRNEEAKRKREDADAESGQYICPL